MLEYFSCSDKSNAQKLYFLKVLSLSVLLLTPDSLIFFLHIYSSFLYMVLSVWLLSLQSLFPHWSCIQCFSEVPGNAQDTGNSCPVLLQCVAR